MKKYITLFLLVGFCNYVKGQETEEVKNVMRTITSSMNANYNVCVANADFPKSLIKEINTYFEKDTLLRLSTEEKKELQSKLLAAQHMPKWESSTVNGIPIIKNDSVKKILGDSTKIWEYFKKKYPEPFKYTLHNFSRPIFIRNNTVCFVYLSQSEYPGLDAENLVGDSSSGGLYIYIKNGNTWVKKIMLFSYIT